jgi:hypothetical protein
MSLSANDSLVALSDIEVNNNASYLAVSDDENTAQVYKAALISPDRVQIILCDVSDATVCRTVRTIMFPIILMNTTKINDGLFVTNLGSAGWLYIASDSGLHGLDLSTFMIVPFLNQINVSVSSLAWSSRRRTIFIGTDMKLWIHNYNNMSEEWRFEHMNGLIDARGESSCSANRRPPPPQKYNKYVYKTMKIIYLIKIVVERCQSRPLSTISMFIIGLQ